MTTTENTLAPENRRHHKVRALLAGGIVLGVGAAVTLANWTDTNWADGIFGGGTYRIESSADGVDFETQGGPEDAVELVWDADTTNAYPGQEFESTWFVRVTDESTYDGVVKKLTTEGATTDGFYVESLTIDGHQVDGNGRPVDAAGDPAEVILAQGTDGAPGSPIEIDLVVKATNDPDKLAKTIGEANHQTITWTLHTASVPASDD